MTAILDQTFDALTAGTALTTGNTQYTQFNGTGTSVVIAGGAHGNAVRLTTVASSDLRSMRLTLPAPVTEFYRRFYIRFSALPSIAVTLLSARLAGGTARAEVRLNTAGQIVLRDATVVVATAVGALALNTWHRVELHAGPTSHTVRIYAGANRDGATPSETLTGAATLASSDEITVGIGTALASWTLDFDDDQHNTDTWPGSSVPNTATTVTTGQATETDSGLTTAKRRKIRVNGAATETDSALPAVRTFILNETFDALTAGVALSTANTQYTQFNGTGTSVAIADGVAGGAARLATVAATDLRSMRITLLAPVGEFYRRFYIRFSALPSLTVTLLSGRLAGGTARADVRINSAGQIVLRDQAAAIATSVLVLAPNVWHRIESHIGVTSHEVRIYAGANMHGTTPDEVLTGAAVAATADEITVGIGTALAGWQLDLDEDRHSADGWPGPAVAPSTGADTAGIGLPIFSTAGGGGPAPAPLVVYGINAHGVSGGGGARTSISDRLADYGRVPINRWPYYGLDALPATFDANLTVFPEKRAFSSFKRMPLQILDGSYDARITSYVSSVPPGWTSYLVYWHEPNEELRDALFTPTDYKNAWYHYAAVVDAAPKQPGATVVPTINFTGPGNGVFSNTWLPDVNQLPASTIFAIDKYINPPPAITATPDPTKPYNGLYFTPAAIFGQTVTMLQQFGWANRWAVGEFNAPRRTADADEVYRLQVLEDYVQYLLSRTEIGLPRFLLLWTGDGTQFDQNIYTPALRDWWRGYMMASG